MAHSYEILVPTGKIFFALVTLASASNGPGKKETAPPKTAPPRAATMPSLGRTDAPVLPPAVTPPPAGPAAAMTVKQASGDNVAFYRPTDKLGNVATDLEVLNSALMGYATDGVQRAPFYDLSNLVKVGLLKKLPTAPPGKKHVFAPKPGQAKLENQCQS